MPPTGDKDLKALGSALTAALAGGDTDAFVRLWPALAAEYARGLFARLAEKVPARSEPEIIPLSGTYGLLRLPTHDGKRTDLGYLSAAGGTKVVWAYAIARRRAVEAWPAKETKYYRLRLSPALKSSPEIPWFDAATERVASYFQLEPPAGQGEFVLLSRQDELSGSVPAMLNRCDYTDPVTGDIVSSVPDDYHEITHRLFLFNGFTGRALTLLQEGVAEVFNPRPYAAEEAADLTPGILAGMLDDKFFYSDTRNFTRAAIFCDGLIKLLGMDAYRELYRSGADDFFQVMEKLAGCGAGEFLSRIKSLPRPQRETRGRTVEDPERPL